jgi:hypothetical protein
VNLFATSVNLWEISQPIRDIVVDNLRSNISVPVRFSYTITRNPPNQDDSEDIAAVVTGENTVNIQPDDQVTRNALIEILNGTSESQKQTYGISFVSIFPKFLFGFSQFKIHDLMPRFLHVKPKAKPEGIDAFHKGLFYRQRISCFSKLLFSFSIGVLFGHHNGPESYTCNTK